MSPPTVPPRGGKWRKLPVVIEAVQWTGGNREEVFAWLRECEIGSVSYIGEQKGVGRQLEIETLQDRMLADPGHWIIRGVKGELYPCAPDIFAATYEPAGDEPVPPRGGWLPIASAPKDGTPIDLWCNHPIHGGMRSADMRCGSRGVWRNWMGEPLNPLWEATHWQPVPAPPGDELGVSPELRDRPPRERIEAALDVAAAALEKIAGQAGIPDPLEACRAILATVDRTRAAIAELRR